MTDSYVRGAAVGSKKLEWLPVAQSSFDPDSEWVGSPVDLYRNGDRVLLRVPRDRDARDLTFDIATLEEALKQARRLASVPEGWGVLLR